jgi:DNA-binding MarR family transcriptional regulator
MNALGLKRASFYGHLSELSEEGYITITSIGINRTDACNITPKGRAFLNKPHYKVHHPTGGDPDEPDEPETRILTWLAYPFCDPYPSSIAVDLKINPPKLALHINRLRDRGYVTSNSFHQETGEPEIRPTNKALEFLDKRGLI